MKNLTILAAAALGLAACTPAPEPIYDASVYDGGKAGSLLPLAQEAASLAPATSPRPKARPSTRCWNDFGQHNNFPGCPWFATGGGDIVNGGNDDGGQTSGGSSRGPSGGGDSGGGTPPAGGDDQPSGGGDPGGDGPVNDDRPSGNPGNDKDVGKAGENPNGQGGWGSGDRGQSQ